MEGLKERCVRVTYHVVVLGELDDLGEDRAAPGLVHDAIVSGSAVDVIARVISIL